MPIPVETWLRLRRRIEKCRTSFRLYATGAAGSFGVAVGYLGPVYADLEAEKGVGFNALMFGVALFLSVVFLLLSRESAHRESESLNAILEEMDELTERFAILGSTPEVADRGG